MRWVNPYWDELVPHWSGSVPTDMIGPKWNELVPHWGGLVSIGGGCTPGWHAQRGWGPSPHCTHSQPLLGCRAASQSRRARCGWRRSSSAAAARPPARYRGCGAPRCAPWCSACPAHPGTPPCWCCVGSSPRPGSVGCPPRHPALRAPAVPTRWHCRGGSQRCGSSIRPWGSRGFTCSLTLAVSRGKVQRSAMQAAVPALKNFTAAVGGTSGGFRPTMMAGGERKGWQWDAASYGAPGSRIEMTLRCHSSGWLQTSTESNPALFLCILRETEARSSLVQPADPCCPTGPYRGRSAPCPHLTPAWPRAPAPAPLI